MNSKTVSLLSPAYGGWQSPNILLSLVCFGTTDLLTFCKIEHPARPRRRSPEKSSPHCSCPVSALSQAQLPELRDLTQEISQLNYSSFSKNGSCRTQLPVWDLPEQPFPVQAECWLSCRVAGKGWKRVGKGGKGVPAMPFSSHHPFSFP